MLSPLLSLCDYEPQTRLLRDSKCSGKYLGLVIFFCCSHQMWLKLYNKYALSEEELSFAHPSAGSLLYSLTTPNQNFTT